MQESSRNQFLCLSHIINKKFITYVEKITMPQISDDILFAIYEDWKKNLNNENREIVFSTLKGATTAFQVIGMGFLIGIKKRELQALIISSITYYEIILQREYIKNDSKQDALFRLRMIEHLSLPFDLNVIKNDTEKPYMRITIMEFATENIWNAIINNKSFGKKEWETAFSIVFGIIDYIVSINYYRKLEGYNSPSETGRISECIQKLLKLLIIIDTSSENHWDKMKEHWIPWSNEYIIFDNWCSLFEKAAEESIESLLSQKNDDNAFLRLLSKILIFEKVNNTQSIERFARCLERFSNFISSKANSLSKVFIPKFPVQYIADYLIDKALILLETSQNEKLLLATLSLLNKCGFDDEHQKLLLYIVDKLQRYTLDILDKLVFDERIKILTSNEFMKFLFISPYVFSIVPKLINYFEIKTNETPSELPNDLFILMISLSAFHSFQLQSKTITALEKYSSSCFSKLAVLWLLMLYGDSSSSPLFNKILDEQEDENIDKNEFTRAFFEILTVAPYAVKTSFSRILSEQNLLKITNFITTLNEDTIFTYLIAMIELISSNNIVPTSQVILNSECITQFPEVLNIFRQCRIPRYRVSLPQLPTNTNICGYFSYKNSLYTIYESEAKVPFECEVAIRDEYGTSVVVLNEIFSKQTPELANIERPKQHEIKKEIIDVKLEGTPLIKSDPLTDSQYKQILNDRTLPPFSKTERRRPLMFEIIRSLGFINELNQIHIFPNNTEFEQRVERLDHTYSVPTVYIPVYYIDQNSTEYPYSWDPDNVSVILGSFNKKIKSQVYVCNMQTIRLSFVKYNSKRVDNTPQVSLVLNFSGFQLQKDILGEKCISSPTVISISPLRKDVFEVKLETKGNDLSKGFENGVIVSTSLMKVYVIYLSMLQLLKQGTPLFIKGIEKRKEKESKIISQFGNILPLDYLFDKQK